MKTIFLQKLHQLTHPGSIITLEEMSNHKVIMREAYKEVIPGIGLTLYSISPPGSGPVISYMLKILDGGFSDQMFFLERKNIFGIWTFLLIFIYFKGILRFCIHIKYLLIHLFKR